MKLCLLKTTFLSFFICRSPSFCHCLATSDSLAEQIGKEKFRVWSLSIRDPSVKVLQFNDLRAIVCPAINTGSSRSLRYYSTFIILPISLVVTLFEEQKLKLTIQTYLHNLHIKQNPPKWVVNSSWEVTSR